ncbi:MAG: PIN domain-containing protein [Gemmataceae bacterium]|nr:PIN domain-containing protein [Gemmataceae bacterium]
MRVLLDSSTLIASLLPDHVHHSVAHAWLSQAKARAFQLVVSGHSIAEVYSVLTRMPRTPRISPAVAWQLLSDNVTGFAEIVTLTGADYVALVNDLSMRGIVGGPVYDAIIAKAAELGQVDKLVTLNEADFLKVYPNIASRLVAARSVAPPTS